MYLIKIDGSNALALDKNNENIIMLYGKEYKIIINSDGEEALKRYDEKSKMWVTLKFKPSTFNDTEAVDLLKLTTRNALFGTIQP